MQHTVASSICIRMNYTRLSSLAIFTCIVLKVIKFICNYISAQFCFLERHFFISLKCIV